MNKGVANITQIAPLSSHDGPGMRTTLFFKGCPIRCKWCHNPETWSFKREIQWDERKCIGCGTCSRSCENGAFDMNAPYPYNSSKCILCGKCVANCPAKALSFVSRQYDVDEVCTELTKDIDLMKALEGGITFSGGEPASQYLFIDKVLTKLKPLHIHIALDTCGYVPFENYELLLPNLDLILFDIKEIDTVKHKLFTGVFNVEMLQNLIKIDKFIVKENLNTKIWIRTPLIPGMTASKENIMGIAEFLKNNSMKSIEQWDMCAFNNLCAEKYKKLGIDWELKDLPLLTSEELEEYKKIANNILKNEIAIDCSGLTARE